MLRRNRGREQRAEQLIARVEAVVNGDDSRQAQALVDELTDVWRELGGGDLKERVWTECTRLHRVLSRAAERRTRRAMKPCPCGASELRLSGRLTLAELAEPGSSPAGPSFRLLLCPSCGRTSWLAADVDELLASGRFPEVVRLEPGAPYR